MYTVLLSRDAEREFDACDGPLQRKLLRCFAALGNEPRRHNNVRRLKGKYASYWRFRVGDWRVIYAILDDKKEVHVIDIVARGDAYE